jgi:nucleoside-diphosphate-sugar epimerase
LLDITTFLDQKEPGKVEEKKHQLQSAAKLHIFPKQEELLRCGEMDFKPDPFLYIDECIEATRRLMESNFMGPVNIGSEEMVTINELVETAAKVSGKVVQKLHKLDAPLGVRGRNSNNDLIFKELGWDYSQTLEEGIHITYNWILEQTKK